MKNYYTDLNSTGLLGVFQIPILVFGNNPNFYEITMEEYVSDQSTYEKLKPVDFLLLDVAIPSEVFLIHPEIRQSLNLGKSIPIVITSIENMDNVIKNIEINIQRHKFQ